MKKFTLSFLLIALVAGFQTLSAQSFSINFDIQNGAFTGTPGTDQAFEFDVLMKADQAGSYHSRGQVYVYYNTGLFGNNVVANSKVSYQLEELLNEELLLPTATPKYTLANQGTDNGNRFAYTWQPSFPIFLANLGGPGNDSHTPLETTFKKVFHFKLDIPQANQRAGLTLADAGVAFDLSLMSGQQFYINASNNEVAYLNGFLPVEMLDFTAEKIANDQVALDWSTSKEVNNDFFVLEKRIASSSTDIANADFAAVTTVDGQGTTDEVSAYNFVDGTKMDRIVQYRLKQVDFDGSFAYSDVIEVNFDFTTQQFYTYPASPTDQVTLKARGELDADYRFAVLDMSGRSLKAGVLSQGVRGGEVQIDISGLSAGMYFIRTTSPAGDVTSVRFQKQ